MTSIDLATRLVDVVNGGDTDSFLSLFAPGGSVDDWGRLFAGPQEIRRWSDEEFIGAQGHMGDVAVTVTDDVVTIVSLWTSNRHTGPSRFELRTDGDRLASMTITEA